MVYGFIYRTINLVNGKMYIGRRKCKDEDSDNRYLGSSPHLNNAILKYGRENFSREILEYCEDEEQLTEREVYYLKKFNCVESEEYYNVTDSPYRSGIHGYRFTEESKDRMSASAKRKFSDPAIRAKYTHPHKMSEEGLKKIRESTVSRLKGKPLSLEHREKVRLSKLGDKNPFYGKELSPTHRANISAAISGKKKRPGHSENTSKANLGMKFINNGVVTRRARGGELENLLREGWVLGQVKKGCVSLG